MSEQKSDMIEAVSLQYLAEVLQGAGYRTNESEQNGSKQLLSASQGIGFAVRPGNPCPFYTFDAAVEPSRVGRVVHTLPKTYIIKLK